MKKNYNLKYLSSVLSTIVIFYMRRKIFKEIASNLIEAFCYISKYRECIVHEGIKKAR